LPSAPPCGGVWASTFGFMHTWARYLHVHAVDPPSHSGYPVAPHAETKCAKHEPGAGHLPATMCPENWGSPLQHRAPAPSRIFLSTDLSVARVRGPISRET